MSVRILAVGGAAVLALASAAHAQSLLFKKGLNKPGKPLKGLVDLHTHPMAHLGFGGHMVHGAPDVGTLMPAGTAYSSRGSIFGGGKNCNEQDVRATSIGEALGSCSATHGGVHGDGNNCGNNVRRLVLSKMGGNPDAHGRDDNDVATLSNPFHPIRHPQGWPSFAAWPKHSDIQHQQMWVDWVKRAYEGGLRVMVALTVNSMTLRKGIAGNTPDDDKTTGDRQIDELKLMVGRHPWMKIASSAADLRRIVAADKLAVIIGSEVDDIGNFAWSMREGRGMPTESQVGAEIQRLWAKGVRYIFPVHVIDNHFGGTAIYEPEFPRASRYHFGRWPSIVCADRRDGITRRISNGADLSKLLALGAAGGAFPLPASCPSGVGYVNSRGLTPLGRYALTQMMKRGMIIDIDHMSQRTVEDTIAFTARTPGGAYPLVSGHNGLRAGFESGRLGTAGRDVHENTRTPAQYRAIAERSGVVGIGWGDSHARAYLENVRKVLRINPELSVNLGSDINGLVAQPRPEGCDRARCVTYSASFPQAKTGTRTWDYNQDGVAHIGLFPDFLRHVENVGGREVVGKLFDGAEGFARMWERAEAVGRSVRPAPAADLVTPFDAVDVLITTGGDDIRGGAGSAFVSIEFKGGASREVDVTHLGKGAGTSGRVRVPLGRRIRRGDLVGVKLRHISNDCFLCARDYWDVNTLVVDAVGVGTVLQVPAFRFGHEAKVFTFR